MWPPTLSGGLFYKSITDNIFIARFQEEREGETFTVAAPQNVEQANLFGFEGLFQNASQFLPSPLDGLGILDNYTWVTSRADLPGRLGMRSDLPGQAKSIYNLSISYEKHGFSGRISWNYHGPYLAEVGSDPRSDVFVDRHLQLDLSLSQRLTKNLRLYAELVNLNNEPLRLYQNLPDRPVQEEFYSWWGAMGLKLDF